MEPFLECRQHCLAPDYVMCHEDVLVPFAEACHFWTRHFYGAEPRKSKDFGRIGSTLQMKKLVKILDGALAYALPEEGGQALLQKPWQRSVRLGDRRGIIII